MPTFGKTYSATSNSASPFNSLGPLVWDSWFKAKQTHFIHWNDEVKVQNLNLIFHLPLSGSWGSQCYFSFESHSTGPVITLNDKYNLFIHLIFVFTTNALLVGTMYHICCSFYDDRILRNDPLSATINYIRTATSWSFHIDKLDLSEFVFCFKESLF